MCNRSKKVLAIVLSVTCLIAFTFTPVFASVTSPKDGDTFKGPKNGVFTVISTKDGTAYMSGMYKKAKKKTINKTYSYAGQQYTVTKIGKDAFKKSKKKLRQVNIKSPKLTKVDKKAFKGCKKSKIKVYVTKKMSKKNYKKLKKALKKAGIKSKNIKKSKKF